MTGHKVVIFSRGAGNQQYGLGLDARLLEQTLLDMGIVPKHQDPYMYVGTESADIHIYLEVPCKAAFPWARLNVIIPNAEWWLTDAWSWALTEPSAFFLFKSRHSKKLFGSVRGAYIGWRGPDLDVTVPSVSQVLYIIGGSVNKLAASRVIIDAWKPTYPPLIVVGSGSGVKKENVRWISKYISQEERRELQKESMYHCVASVAEGFGYTCAEAMLCGAQPLWTDIPVYSENWGEELGSVGQIKTKVGREGKMLDTARTFTKEAVWAAMDSLLAHERVPARLGVVARGMNKAFRGSFAQAWARIEGLLQTCSGAIGPPKVLQELPALGVITLVHNRPEWFFHSLRNIEISSYPPDKLHWVIVDDSEPAKRVDTMIARIREKMPHLKIYYVSIGQKTSIGEKRNKGCTAALAVWPHITTLAFMDDDDHYPPNSLPLRVSWLASSNMGAVACATLPMYDLTRYISAMNVPPLDLKPSQRVSEATLCFKREFWRDRPFSHVSVAEGEEFLEKREWLEIPPTNVIVSFLHGKNSTSRRIPETREPNGCHYGFSDDYFTLIHGIAAHV